jgi:hypothetical protein
MGHLVHETRRLQDTGCALLLVGLKGCGSMYPARLTRNRPVWRLKLLLHCSGFTSQGRDTVSSAGTVAFMFALFNSAGIDDLGFMMPSGMEEWCSGICALL